jgi:sec-independent protein translocase protein TatA
LGGAVKGFKDGMKTGEDKAEQIPQQAAAQQTASADKTVDVQAKDLNK